MSCGPRREGQVEGSYLIRFADIVRTSGQEAKRCGRTDTPHSSQFTSAIPQESSLGDQTRITEVRPIASGLVVEELGDRTLGAERGRDGVLRMGQFTLLTKQLWVDAYLNPSSNLDRPHDVDAPIRSIRQSNKCAGQTTRERHSPIEREGRPERQNMLAFNLLWGSLWRSSKRVSQQKRRHQATRGGDRCSRGRGCASKHERVETCGGAPAPNLVQAAEESDRHSAGDMPVGLCVSLFCKEVRS